MTRKLAGWCVLVLMLAAGVAGPAAGEQERIWPDESIYFLVLDRFRDGDPGNDAGADRSDPRGWHGGDLQGLIEKLPYIQSMGFSALWITPLVRNAGADYHGYGAVDFFAADPHFGSVALARDLVEKAHALGLKVIFDVVVNHTGPRHPLVAEQPGWFHPRRPIRNGRDLEQLREGWLFDLPDFDQSQPAVRDYILRYSRFWIEQTGVDGFRIDTVKHVAPEFFTWYVSELRRLKPGFWVLGEVWDPVPLKLSIYQDAGVTAVTDFPVSMAARAAFGKDASLEQLAATVRDMGRSLADPGQAGAFLDNHDLPRFVSDATDDPLRRLRLGLTFLFTQRSIPVVYYGTEVALTGAGDPDNRRDFPWGQEEKSEVRALITRLNAIRRQHPALRRGTVAELRADRWTYAYARRVASETVVVVLNNHPDEAFSGEVAVDALGLAEGTRLRDALTGEVVRVSAGRIRPALGARSGAVYVEEASGLTLPSVWIAVATALVLGGFWVLRAAFPPVRTWPGRMARRSGRRSRIRPDS